MVSLLVLELIATRFCDHLPIDATLVADFLHYFNAKFEALWAYHVFI